jgi:putative SOS response-associated peptidase YedK
MCGRFANSEDPEIQAAYYQAKLSAKLWRPTWNAAPTQSLPVVLAPAGHERELTLMRWGWEREFDRHQLLVNARGEEAAAKPTWREALHSRRCLVPATAFYEWHEATNQPYAFQLSSRGLFAIGALWEPQGDGRAFVLLTTIANALVAGIHHRMACMLDQEQAQRWLDPGLSKTQVQELITPFPASAMISFPVSKEVNAVAHNAPHLLQPVSIARQQSLFDAP